VVTNELEIPAEAPEAEEPAEVEVDVGVETDTG